MNNNHMKENLRTILIEQHQKFISSDTGIERDLLHQLRNQIKSSFVVVITGLRRVGKSTLLAQIANKYLNNKYYYISFEDERLLNFKVDDFQLLHETLVSLFGDKKTFLIDEIQNIPEWERFVRRMHDAGYKFIITGSNASLLSQELGTRLTGRVVNAELYPFSFSEYLTFKGVNKPNINRLTTIEKGLLRKYANRYLKEGGIPEALKNPNLEIHKSLYENVLYRDIATRYGITSVNALKEMGLYLMSNFSTLITYNSLKKTVSVKSENTIRNFINYFENSWLVIKVNKFAYSIREQNLAPKKVYSIDTGLANSIGFTFSSNIGRLMENCVLIELKRRGLDTYYLKTEKGNEIDFYIPNTSTNIQVTQHISDSNKGREIENLLEVQADNEKVKESVVITEREFGEISEDKGKVRILPLYYWLLDR